MKKEEKLREEYEDAYLALLMSEVAKAKGAELLKENERLKADPDFEVPESVTERSMATIRREFRRQTGKKTVRFAGRIFTRVACVAVLAALMLVTAYATIPSFRVGAQNLIMESTALETFISLKDDPVKEEATVLLGYQIPDVPKGFVLEAQWEGASRAWVKYTSKDSRTIKIQLSRDTKHTIAADTEKAEAVPVLIQGNDGLISEKDEAVYIAWNDTRGDMFISVLGEGVDRDAIKEIADRIVFVSNTVK